MSKILYVGFYDYSYSCHAYELKNNEFEETNLSDDVFEFLYDRVCIWKSDNKTNLDTNQLQKYDEIVICNDGEFYHFNVKEILS